MSLPNSFTVSPAWQLLIRDIGGRPVNVLRRAGLPDDLFRQQGASLSTDEYFQFWKGLEEEINDPFLPLRMGKAISVEYFDPAIFAAMCSPDLNTALTRIAKYKKLVCPMKLDLDISKDETRLTVHWLNSSVDAPASMYLLELVFFVQLARMATRENHLIPVKLITPKLPDEIEPYTEYFGRRMQKGEQVQLTFSALDARRPFLTANQEMWKFFEPQLQKRLSELEAKASESERVKAALLELLPGGDSSIDSVCKKLGTSKRTLQRRLTGDGVTYQAVLNRTRTDLALYYLKNPELSGTEISFLLGYDDPNSFFRAFHTWTGKTAEQMRAAVA